MDRAALAGFSIAAVSRQTGIPVTTLRFYERELPALFPLRKTPGGHRRYTPRDVQRLAAVRRLTEAGGLTLSDLRRVIVSRGDREPLREDLDALRQSQADQSASLEDLGRRLRDLESRLSELEASRRRGWFGVSRKPGRPRPR